MDVTRSNITLFLVTVLACCQLTHSASTASPETTTVAAATQGPTTEGPTTEGPTTQAPTTQVPVTETQTTQAPSTDAATSPPSVSTTTQSLQDIISKAVSDAVAKSLKELMGSLTTSTAAPTTTAAPETTTAAVTSTTAPRQRSCPQGIYDTVTQSVKFLLEEKECEITVYLSKLPKVPKGPKGPKGFKGPKGPNTGLDNVVATPLFEPDLCPDMFVEKQSKDAYWIEAGECFMFVAKSKGKGKYKNDTPLILSRPL